MLLSWFGSVYVNTERFSLSYWRGFCVCVVVAATFQFEITRSRFYWEWASACLCTCSAFNLPCICCASFIELYDDARWHSFLFFQINLHFAQEIYTGFCFACLVFICFEKYIHIYLAEKHSITHWANLKTSIQRLANVQWTFQSQWIFFYIQFCWTFCSKLSTYFAGSFCFSFLLFSNLNSCRMSVSLLIAQSSQIIKLAFDAMRNGFSTCIQSYLWFCLSMSDNFFQPRMITANDKVQNEPGQAFYQMTKQFRRSTMTCKCLGRNKKVECLFLYTTFTVLEICRNQITVFCWSSHGHR